MKDNKVDWAKVQIAKRYYLDELSSSEERLFEKWMKEDQDFKSLVESMPEASSWKNDLAQFEKIDVEKAWNKFSDHTPSESPSPRFAFLAAWPRYAAVLFVIVLSAYAIYASIGTEEVVEVHPGGSFSNRLGTVSSFLLPDSSKVWLSTGSELSYAADFIRNRKVSLQGEAFFEVKRSEQFPFEIQTDRLRTRVLGTSFNLKAYQDEPVTLSVYTGKVQFGKKEAKEQQVLISNQSINWSLEHGFSPVQVFDASSIPGWRSGVFHFENATLEEVTGELAKWYPLKFDIIGMNTGCRYSGEFRRSSLEEVLEILSYSLNLKYQINEKTVKLTLKPC